MNEYKFTVNWFGSTDKINSLESILSNLNRNDKLHFLEIGSYEGRSTVWFLDNYLLHKDSSIRCIDPWEPYTQVDDKDVEFDLNGIFNTFEHNINISGSANKVNICRMKSKDGLLHEDTRINQYDMIFIDGNHTAKCVLQDAVYAWDLLKTGGILIFDDYLWRKDQIEKNRPQIAVDSFIKCFVDHVEVIHSGYRLALKKLM